MERVEPLRKTPSSTASVGFRRVSHNLLLRINILSLDAPMVALAWQYYLGRLFHTEIHFASKWILGSTVWLIYMADRRLDSRRKDDVFLGSRHRYLRRYGSKFLSPWFLILLLNAAMALFFLPKILLLTGTIIGLATILYLKGIHAEERFISFKAWKEISIGFLFSLGTCGTLLVLAPPDSMAPLFVTLPLFALLCSLNCILISIWEINDSGHAEIDCLIQKFPFIHSHTTELITGFLLLSIAFSAICPLAHPVLPALFISGLSLLMIDTFLTETKLNTRRVLADLALVLPVLLL